MFEHAFEEPPAVIVAVQHTPGGETLYVKPRMKRVKDDMVEIGLQGEGGKIGEGQFFEGTFKVAYIAMNHGAEALDGLLLSVVSTPKAMTEKPRTIEVDEDAVFEHAPAVFADAQTYHGPNAIDVRSIGITPESSILFLDEDGCRCKKNGDSYQITRKHPGKEIVSVLSVGRGALRTTTTPAPPKTATVPPNSVPHFETVPIELDHEQMDTPVSGPFESPVLFASTMSTKGGDPGLVIAMSHKEPTGASRVSAKILEPSCYDAWHTVEEATLLLADQGSFPLANGGHMEVGTVVVPSDGGWYQFKFATPFAEPPVMVVYVQHKWEQYVKARLSSIGPDGFTVGLQGEGERMGNYMTFEGDLTVAFMAMAYSEGAEMIGGKLFGWGKTAPEMTEKKQRIPFHPLPGFEVEPAVFGTIGTYNGPNAADVRNNKLDEEWAELTLMRTDAALTKTARRRKSPENIQERNMLTSLPSPLQSLSPQPHLSLRPLNSTSHLPQPLL
uniref:Uncharacterized protein n=1 Tax=Chromera velia CCMP2878 TaxID=1169474 RepID=A0A0G4H163_9ALVE|eukprot:Cvel_807.t1-p1 / transcript=Cvel_807.t1 / gene=Cvel_807 / organism=Chromera_velia_CCMP2878 / gene_product=hypothetical protein / transcript_product=hypothetical protein / location=Cvel_scaffold25:73993-76606(-) / protein_length=498 / sequence_SO=supercontig / SO=protein_coding / is_pseudo=false